MSRRIAVVQAATDLGTTGTKTFEIRLREQISMMTLVFEYTVVTVSVMLAHIAACISKIELVDGSETIFSLTGRQAQGVAFYEKNVHPLNQYSLTVGGTMRCTIPMLFGRELWDELYAFRPDLYDNPILRITWDEDASNTSVIVNAFAAYAYVDDAPKAGPANGLILTREHKATAMAASDHDYTQLPTDYPLRRLFVQALSEDHDTFTLLSNLKVGIENDRVIPFNIPADDFFHMLASQYGEIVEHLILDNAVTAKTIYLLQCQNAFVQISYDGTAYVTTQTLNAVPTFTGEKLALAASVDIKALTGKIAGFVPHGVFPIDFGDPMEPDTWLQVAGVNDIRLDVTSSSDADSGDSLAVITQQPVLYGQR